VVFWEEGLKPSQRYLLHQAALVGFEDMKEDISRLRVGLSWHSPRRGSTCYIPKHKSVDKNGPIHRCLASRSATEGYEDIDLGNSRLRVWTENVYVPCRRDGLLCPHVMSVVTVKDQ
jgi:hypothetical protein